MSNTLMYADWCKRIDPNGPLGGMIDQIKDVPQPDDAGPITWARFLEIIRAEPQHLFAEPQK